MTKVDNKKVIRRLALRELKSSRKMNIMVFISIVLTCILFTALTSIGGGLVSGIQEETMRQVGGRSMAGMKYALSEDYEKIKADSATRNVCYRILVGTIANDCMKDISTEVYYASDDYSAEELFSCPETGRLPESYDEIALSTLTLDELGLPHELGITVPAVINIDDKIVSHDFTLCGYWQGDKLAMAQMSWVSRDFTEKNVPVPTVDFHDQQDKVCYSGYWSIDFDYSNSFDIESKTTALISRLYDEPEKIDIGINWAYSASRIDAGMIAGAAMMVLVIFSAGYLIIYNIFHINISANIRSYGLLKTIGTTSRQIKRMVRVQAAVYCAAGIPLGLVTGVLLGKALIGFITVTLNIGSAAYYTVSTDILLPVCLIAAVFTFATVMISCHKPCKAAGSVSPIEALRYNETDTGINKDKKKTRKVTPLSIARNNMSRSRKKSVVVVLSLSLSLILMNTLFTVLSGMDMDKYVSDQIVGDFIVTRSSGNRSDKSCYYRISPDDLDYFASLEGTEDISSIYYQETSFVPSDAPLDRFKTLIDKYSQTETTGELANYPEFGYKFLGDIYGVSDSLLTALDPVKGSIDAEKWKSGRYAIAYVSYADLDISNPDDDLYQPGDKVSVNFSDFVTEEEKTAEYEVMAVCEMPFALSTQSSFLVHGSLIIPDSAYFDICENRSAMTVMINSDDAHYDSISDSLAALTDAPGSDITLKSKETYIKEYEDLVKMLKIVGGSLCGILAMIGILNFINTIVTGIISRRRELAMMNAVGMTGRQLRSMLMWEGIRYAVLTAFISLVLGTPISYFAIKFLFGDMAFFSYHFTALLTGVCIPVLLLLSAVVPFIAYRTLCKESVVERLREI